MTLPRTRSPRSPRSPRVSGPLRAAVLAGLPGPLGLVLLGLVACASNDRAAERALLARYDEVHRAEVAAFERAQAAFPTGFSMPAERTYEGLGTLIVSDCRLIGRPGKAFVRAEFTYVNTTGRRLDGVHATLYVDDPDSGESWGETLLMRVPYRYALTPDSTYTSWLDTPTKGVETKPGWSWDLVLEPLEEHAQDADG